MNDRLYIASMGMVSPLGKNTKQTIAALNAGISVYAESEYDNDNGQPIVMALVPDQVFAEFNGEIDEGAYYCDMFDRTIKMAILALQESLASQNFETTVPLVLAMPEDIPGVHQATSQLIGGNLIKPSAFPFASELLRVIRSGRAGGIEAVDYAFRYTLELGHQSVVIGGSDTYLDYSMLSVLSASDRLLVPGEMDGFAVGEAACFIVLTQNKEKAAVNNGCVVSLSRPGISEELGHLSSDEPYRGDGLSQAFRQALAATAERQVAKIYSSMNGERFWAKEYGVASMRNSEYLREDVEMIHPAEYFGDIGAASGSMLIGLAASELYRTASFDPVLVYASSDGPSRGAIVLTKEQLTSEQQGAPL